MAGKQTESESNTSNSPHLEWPKRPERRHSVNEEMPASTRGMLVAVLLFILAGSSGVYLFYVQPERQQLFGLRAALAPVAPAAAPEQTAPAVRLTPTPQSSPTPTLPPSAAPSASAAAQVTHTSAPTSTAVATATPGWLTADILPLPEGKWIEVDLGRQLLTAHAGLTDVFTMTISTGSSVTAASAGKYRITEKLASRLLTGPGYYLPDVPWVMLVTPNMLFDGAYWLDTFGTPSQHGSINLRPEDAQRLFEWAEPVMPQDAASVKASSQSPGTWVIIHP